MRLIPRRPWIILIGKTWWVCVYSWGIDTNLAPRQAYLVVTWRPRWTIYLSPDATPRHATWGLGLNRES